MLYASVDDVSKCKFTDCRVVSKNEHLKSNEERNDFDFCTTSDFRARSK